MNAIQENTAVFPDRRAKSGVLLKRYSNAEEETLTAGTSGSDKGTLALGWFNSASGLISSIFGFVSENKYGTAAYNNARAAEANAEAAKYTSSGSKNTGLWIALAVVGVIVIGLVVFLSTKKK